MWPTPNLSWARLWRSTPIWTHFPSLLYLKCHWSFTTWLFKRWKDKFFGIRSRYGNLQEKYFFVESHVYKAGNSTQQFMQANFVYVLKSRLLASYGDQNVNKIALKCSCIRLNNIIHTINEWEYITLAHSCNSLSFFRFSLVHRESFSRACAKCEKKFWKFFSCFFYYYKFLAQARRNVQFEGSLAAVNHHTYIAWGDVAATQQKT